MANPQPQAIGGTGLDATVPFFSPDGRWIGFYAASERKLKKVSVTGGAAVTICEIDQPPNGASWASNDQIFFAQTIGIFRVSANGGKPDAIITVKQGDLVETPQRLPDGDHILFTQTTAGFGADRWDKAQIAVVSLKSGERKVLLEGGADARYVGTGHLVYALGSTLLAVRFDSKRLVIIGGPVPLVEDVSRAFTGAAHFTFASSGTLVHVVANNVASPQAKLVLVDRRGAQKPLSVQAARYADPRISPDGKQLAVTTNDDNASIWIDDLSGATSMRRLTFEGRSRGPLWSRDGQRIFYASTRGSEDALFWQRADGSGSEEQLTKSEPGSFPNSVSPDAKTLAFYTPRNGGDVSILSLAGDRTPKPLISVPVTHQDHANFSPDGRWLAYRSNESGRYEVYVQPFPPTGAKYQITTTGAQSPLWSPDGKQIFYVETKEETGQLVSIDVRTEPSFASANPTKLPIEKMVSLGGVRPYDITPDGKQFIVMFSASDTADQPVQQQMRITLNWFEELKQRVR
jgi:serine/threonine-protein kinase